MVASLQQQQLPPLIDNPHSSCRLAKIFTHLVIPKIQTRLFSYLTPFKFTSSIRPAGRQQQQFLSRAGHTQNRFYCVFYCPCPALERLTQPNWGPPGSPPVERPSKSWSCTPQSISHSFIIWVNHLKSTLYSNLLLRPYENSSDSLLHRCPSSYSSSGLYYFVLVCSCSLQEIKKRSGHLIAVINCRARQNRFTRNRNILHRNLILPVPALLWSFTDSRSDISSLFVREAATAQRV